MKVSTLITPMAEKMAVREAADHTMLSIEELGLAFGISPVAVGIWIRATPVLVNLFWHEERGKEKGTIHVSTLKGEETLAKFYCWRDFWDAVVGQNWIFDGGYGYLNSPNLPDLGNSMYYSNGERKF
jgi:hypothetical protein